MKLLVARHRETGEQSNWGGETQKICSGRARAFTGAGGRGREREGRVGGGRREEGRRSRERDRWTFVLVWGVRKREVGRRERMKMDGGGKKRD